ncbi:MAG: hypothetical protein QJT81_12605 [Candidatus Thiothrix putei]|uniref:Secreted protein n=1 Tax=Candidatus Thiothrix putei TaxID=3080811 RepID=A0AA95KHP5_9GAMM|nr:MAG: hypothetical protein QJT81_12605 [Candidatus Thiothrix putei]
MTYKYIVLSLIVLSFPVIAFAESGRFTETHNKASNEVDKNKIPNKYGATCKIRQTELLNFQH